MSDLARLQNAARYGRLILTAHAREEAGNANVGADDIRCAILSATSAVIQPKNQNQPKDRYLLTGGCAFDGIGLSVVVEEIQPGLLIVTVF